MERRFLTRATIRQHAIALCTSLWILVVWSHAVPGPLDRFGTLRGVDFLQFYAAGRFAAERPPAALYDWGAFIEALPRLADGADALEYLPIYPPVVGLAFAPLARFSYPTALALWTAVSLALYAAAVVLGMRSLTAVRPFRLEAALLAAGFPALVQLVAHGQIAAPAILLVVLAWRGFRADRPWLTGLAFGSLAYKPQLLVFAAVAGLMWPRRRFWLGVLTAAVGQWLVAGLVFGWSVLPAYVDTMLKVAADAARFEPKVWQMHSLRGAIELLAGQRRAALVIWLAAVPCVLWLCRRVWRQVSDPRLRFAAVCLTALVLNPHLYVYDLVLLVPPLGLLADWAIGEGDQDAARSVGVTAYALAWAPLVGPLARLTHVQVTPVLMLALLWQLTHVQPDSAGCLSADDPLPVRGTLSPWGR